MNSRAAPQFRYPVLTAQGLVFIGWFLLDAVKTTLGSAALDFHFYDMAAIIANPLRLLTGVGTDAGILTTPFALLCLAVIVAPLLPVISRGPLAALARFAPLVLMVACASILYYQTRQDTFIVAQNSNDVTASLTRLANVLTRRAGGLVSRHIVVGAGSWVAGCGALLLACTATSKDNKTQLSE